VVALTLTPRDRNNRNNAISCACHICHICHIGAATVINLSAKGRLSKLSNRLPTPTLTYVFTVIFYGLKVFCCKVTQFCVTQRECRMAETPSVRNGAQAGESARKNSFVN
jgi:hypothetical protein